jgi:type II secretory pathway pseudopilin PulG
MRTLRQRLRPLEGDEGIGMTELVVALMIFALIAVGVGYSLFSMTRLTRESTNRETAAHLAAQEVDRVQSLPDAFGVHSSTATSTIDGTEYTISTSVGWVSTTGASGACGSGGGNLQYKRVNVSVTWPGMYLDRPVRADSALAPDSRINDPSYGTVLVSVLGIDGTGRSGVTVRVTPESGGGGQTITEPISATDVDGCTYVLKVSPGKYKIEVERSGYIDSSQVAVPSYTQQVVEAGATTTASFQYEAAGTFALHYAATSAADPDLPSGLDTTFIGGLVNYVTTGTPATRKLHPFISGYQAVAGDPSTCLNVDPQNWTADTTYQDGVRPGAVSAAPGDSATLAIGMGVFKIHIPSATNQDYVTAIQQSGASGGNPGCASPKTYKFSSDYPNDVDVTLALPYGEWKLYLGNYQGDTSHPVTSGVTPIDGALQPSGFVTGGVETGILGASTFTGGVLILDPRQPL